MQCIRFYLFAAFVPLGLGLAMLSNAALAQSPAAPADISGDWTIAGVMAAPWATSTRVERRWIGASISFHDGRMAGPNAFTCGGAQYEVVQSVPRGLFQGGLAADTADRDAQAFGLANPATTYRVNCDTGSFDFHQASDDLVIGYDNQILRLRRAGK